jgi:hypothetical protein
MVSIEEAFAKDFPEESKTMNDAAAPILSRIRAESIFNVYRKGWEAGQFANREMEARYRGRGGQRVRQLIQEGKEHEYK